MHTQLWNLKQNKPLAPQLAEAARLLQAGEVVAFPTETVYGLGANGLQAEACSKIFAAKGRPADNPLILHIAALEQLEGICGELSEQAQVLMQHFWPGPLTLIVPKGPLVPEVVTAGLETVAIRMPQHAIAQALIQEAGCPVAAPSANKSGRPSPTTAAMVAADMEGVIAGIVDGGACAIGVESTIVDTTTEVATILRPGGITAEMLQEVLGQVALDPGLVQEQVAPKAPGMKYRHYAPKAEMFLVEGPEAREALATLAQAALASDLCVGVLADEAALQLLPESEQLLPVAWGNAPAELAHTLYQDLCHFNQTSVQVILALGVAETGLGLAIMNRLQKAAGRNILWAEQGKIMQQSGKAPMFCGKIKGKQFLKKGDQNEDSNRL